MIYERVCYMCPKCNHMHFFNAEEIPTIICPECNVQMVCVEKKFVSAEQEKKDEERRERLYRSYRSATIVNCPYCNSINTSKISTTSKAVNTAIFGIWGTKRHKQWHCNQCGSDF